MRAPPPVEFSSALVRAWRVALSLLVGAAVAVPMAWGLPYIAAFGDGPHPGAQFEALGNPLLQGGMAASAAAMAIAFFWTASRRAATCERTLRWDGQDWVLAGGVDGQIERRGDAALMLDLGPWMLVRFTARAGSRPFSVGCRLASASWLPLSAGADPARWAALRGALWNWRAGRGEAR